MSQGGDYVLAVKDNHKTMADDLRDLFEGCDAVEWTDVLHNYGDSMNTGHGRIETRRCSTPSAPTYVTYMRRHASWLNLTTVIRLERQHTSGGQSSREVACFLSSKATPAAFFLQVIRNH